MWGCGSKQKIVEEQIIEQRDSIQIVRMDSLWTEKMRHSALWQEIQRQEIIFSSPDTAVPLYPKRVISEIITTKIIEDENEKTNQEAIEKVDKYSVI